MEAVAAIGNAVSLVKRLCEISRNIKDAEFANLLADLSMNLADAKLQVAELKERLATREDEIRALKSATLGARQRPIIKWGCYQFEDEEGLFCTACYDSKGMKNRTTRLSSKHRECPVCKAVLGT